MAVKPIPDGYRTVTPYLIVEDVRGLIEFAKAVFDARETECMEGPDGNVMHAEIEIGDCRVMMGQARGEWKPVPAALYVYVKDTDAVYQRALKEGATSVMEPADQFYGDRNGGVQDRFGNLWWIATHIEDVSPEEMRNRVKAMGRQ